MIHYSHCPICGSDNILSQLVAKDYTVSQKEFSIWQCNTCTAKFTQDVPAENEIAAYYTSDKYISHSDTKKGLVNTLYHLVRKRTLSAKRKLLIRHTGMKKGSVLDIGCGTGAFLHTVQQAGWTVTGLEPDATARRKAEALYQLQVGVPQKLFELKPGTFHAITLWHVLEHVHELHAYLKTITTLIAPGGKIFIAVPNYTSYDAAVYKQCWAAYDVPRHLYHFSPLSMQQLVATYGLQFSAIKPMWFDSFYVSMLSEKYRTGKSNIFRACWNGLLSNIKALQNKNRCSSIIYILEKKN